MRIETRFISLKKLVLLQKRNLETFSLLGTLKELFDVADFNYSKLDSLNCLLSKTYVDDNWNMA